jgi:hypothetical protein
MVKQYADIFEGRPDLPRSLSELMSLRLETIRYLCLDAGVALGLLGMESRWVSSMEKLLAAGGLLVMLTFADLAITASGYPQRWTYPVLLLGLLVLAVSGFFGGTAVLWAVANSVAVLFWMGMYKSLRVILLAIMAVRAAG